MKVLRGIVNATLASRNINDYPFVGIGLDAIEWEYGTPPSQMRLLDVDKISNIQKIPIGQSSMTETQAQSHASFMQKFSSEAGLDMKYFGFSASINTKFTQSVRESSSIWFSHRQTRVTGNLISLGEDKNVLREALLPSAKEAIATLSPSELFEAYGTHVVVKAYEGGMAEYFCHSKESSSMTQENFEVAATAAFKSVGGSIKGSTSLSTEEQKSLSNQEGDSSLTVHGGDVKLAQCLGMSQNDCPNTGQSAWDDWAESTKDSPAFMGLASDGLVPIWTLADTPERTAEILMAFKFRLAESVTPEIFYHKGDKSNRPEAKVYLPSDYKILSGGAKVMYDDGGILMTESYPENEGWTARARDSYYSDTGTITAYVIGIYDPMNLWDVKIEEKTSTRAPHPAISVDVSDGYVMVGGGARAITSGDGSFLTSSFPKTIYQWGASSKDHISASEGTVTVYVIGLKSRLQDKGITINKILRQTTSPFASHPSTEVVIPSQYIMTGGGADVKQDGGEGNMLVQSYPKENNMWAVSSKDHGYEDQTFINAYAIGVQVVAPEMKELHMGGAKSQE